ncbi:bifunctional 5,10-methylenetetrahydrofolate dehydrogenase/5,10-methenyltetrahydrofolate cyclohydrolase [Priestia megaterium]
MTIVMNGKVVAHDLIEKMQLELRDLIKKDIRPTLAIVRIGELTDSIAYEQGAKKRLSGIGVKTLTYSYPENISQADFLTRFSSINASEDIHGILLLRPLPPHIDINAVIKLIDPLKDIDGMNPLNLGKIVADDEGCFPPCTPVAVMQILKYYDIDLVGKNVVIVGHSAVVGKPLNILMLNENATVTVCHIHSVDIKQICQKADILVSATGKAGLITKDYVKEGAIVVDVGISLDANGKIHGDVIYEEVAQKADYITPVPGGVGSLTTTILAKHVIEASIILNRNEKPKTLINSL